MAHLNFTDFYQVPDLQFDINKMRSDLFLTSEELLEIGVIDQII